MLIFQIKLPRSWLLIHNHILFYVWSVQHGKKSSVFIFLTLMYGPDSFQ